MFETSSSIHAQIDSAVKEIETRISTQVDALVCERIEKAEQRMLDSLKVIETNFEQRISDAITKRIFIPNLALSKHIDYGEFMRYSTCSAADFFHPRYTEISTMLKIPLTFHRKAWEFIYIIHKLLSTKVISQGKRGLVFGVGAERLPSLFANMGASIVATDAPPSIGIAAGWDSTNQYAASLEKLHYPDLVSDSVFSKNVAYQHCDMNAIDNTLKDFDFNWSSCCFEHLGSLEAGIQFVINAVESTLKVGGIAVHTTEFNLSSNTETIEKGGTVVYRHCDMQALVDRLRGRGHKVEPFLIAPDSHYFDYYIDIPPMIHNPHLKLMIEQYVTTSVGIVVTRGEPRTN